MQESCIFSVKLGIEKMIDETLIRENRIVD